MIEPGPFGKTNGVGIFTISISGAAPVCDPEE